MNAHCMFNSHFQSNLPENKLDRQNHDQTCVLEEKTLTNNVSSLTCDEYVFLALG